jgi:hypothetical protein
MSVVTFKPEITLTLGIDLRTILPDLTENTPLLVRENFRKTIVKKFTGVWKMTTGSLTDGHRVSEKITAVFFRIKE